MKTITIQLPVSIDGKPMFTEAMTAAARQAAEDVERGDEFTTLGAICYGALRIIDAAPKTGSKT